MSDESTKKESANFIRMDEETVNFARSHTSYGIYVDESGQPRMVIKFKNYREFWGLLFEVILFDVEDWISRVSSIIKEAVARKREAEAVIVFEDPNNPSA